MADDINYSGNIIITLAFFSDGFVTVPGDFQLEPRETLAERTRQEVSEQVQERYRAAAWGMGVPVPSFTYIEVQVNMDDLDLINWQVHGIHPALKMYRRKESQAQPDREPSPFEQLQAAGYADLKKIRAEMPWPGARKMPAYVFAGWLGFKSTSYNHVEGGGVGVTPAAVRQALSAAKKLAGREDLEELCQWSHAVYLEEEKNNAKVNDAISEEAVRQVSGEPPTWAVVEKKGPTLIPNRPFNPRPPIVK
jgi:hypothetical protein